MNVQPLRHYRHIMLGGALTPGAPVLDAAGATIGVLDDAVSAYGTVLVQLCEPVPFDATEIGQIVSVLGRRYVLYDWRGEPVHTLPIPYDREAWPGFSWQHSARCERRVHVRDLPLNHGRFCDAGCRQRITPEYSRAYSFVLAIGAMIGRPVGVPYAWAWR